MYLQHVPCRKSCIFHLEVTCSNVHDPILIIQLMCEFITLVLFFPQMRATDHSECTLKDLAEIQTGCIAKKLNPEMLQAFQTANVEFPNRATNIQRCDWLASRVPESEAIQATLNCPPADA